MKKFLIIFLLLFSFTAHAVTIIPEEPSLFFKIIFIVKNCKLNVKCYFNPQKKLGVSYTTIWATTTIASYPTIHNANFEAFNAGKIENSTTSVKSITTLESLTSAGSLATVGTITTGIWRGTIVDETYGGSGTSSPTGLLWGNGTNLYSIASGTANQVLTSNGTTLAPTFQTYATDESGNYTWTGLHRFEGATTTMKGLSSSFLYASSTLELGGLRLTFPTIIQASSTVLSPDLNGNLIWAYPDWQQLGEFVATVATTSLVVENFPARQDLRAILYIPSMNARSATLGMTFKDDGANYAYKTVMDYDTSKQNAASGQVSIKVDGVAGDNFLLAVTDSEYFIFDIFNKATSTKQVHFTGQSATSTIPVYFQGVGVWNNTTRQISTIRFISGATDYFGVGSRLTIYGKRN